MPKKQKIDKRLNQLFKDIKPEEPPSKRTKVTEEAQVPLPESSPVEDKGPKSGPLSIEPVSEPRPATRQTPTLRAAKEATTQHIGSSMALKFQAGQQEWAMLQVVDETAPRSWSEDEQLLVKQVADQLSLALENAQLFQETKKRAEETAVLNDLGRSLASRLTLDQVVTEVYNGITRLLDAKNFYIAFYDRESNEIVFPQNVSESNVDRAITRLPMGEGITAHMIRSGETILIGNGTDRWMAERGLKSAGEPAKSFLGVPIQHSGQIVGAIAIQDYATYNAYTQHDLELLRTFSNQASIAIQNANLFKEISDRQQAQERSEADLRALFAAMEDVVLVVDRDARYIRIAPTNPGRLIRPPEELLGRVMEDFFPWETVQQFKHAIGRTLETGETTQIEYEATIGNNGYWFLASLSKLDEENVFWVARDITERKQAEANLQKRNTYLSVSSEIGRVITSTLDLNTIFSRTVNLISERFGFYHAAIFIVEETGFNAILREATGEPGAEMVRRKHMLAVDSNSIVGKVTAQGVPIAVNNTSLDPLHKKNPLLPETKAEAAIPLRVGNRIIGALDIQSTEVDAFAEDELGVLQTLADQVAVAIDNARSYELSQQAVTEMREIDRLKSQFLANMSHELRTPLNSIIGFSRVILKGIDGPVTELQQQDLTAIYNSGQHLLGLINDILDLSKIEAGKMELAFDEVNMADVTSSVLSTMTGLIKDKAITLKRNIQPDLPTVRADAIRVRQVMINLLSNAAKFTDEGEIVVDVEVKPALSGRPELVVSVTDTGPGISPQDQAKLFQPFSQVDDSPTRKTGGTGLGLSICQHLIQMHGGDIGVHSAPGKGSTFYFTLPLYRKEKETEKSNGGKVILAIDDDPQVIGLYERYLQPQGYQVISLTDPSRAVERVRQLKPFAVTLDIMMPGIDGWQVLNNLKSDAETREIPVIICSIIEDQEKGFSLGASDYLVKPILEEDLVNALDRLNGDGSIQEVLVIDDDPNDLRLIGKMLNDDGRYKPILAQGGRQGWELISSKTPPQAVILDLFMPELDGFQILEDMRADDRLRDIPVIVISGAALTPEQHKRLDEFGQRLLTKGSFSEKELFMSIQRSLQRLPTK